MRRACLSAIVTAAFLATGAAGGELDVAKAALRDGLWSVARAHAEGLPGAEPRLVVLESYAHEGLWDEIGKRLASWTDAVGGAFEYYRAAVAGDFAKAIGLLKVTGSAVGETEAKMLEAELHVKAGDLSAARQLWTEVVARSNAPERAFTIAAVNLGKPEPLREAYARAQSPKFKRLAGLRYGTSLLAEAKTFPEGSRIIRAIVKDTPDAPGAQEAFIALAEAELAASRWREAAAAYLELTETWPETAKLAKVQEGRGWTFLRLGKFDDSLEAFRRAEKLAADNPSRALAALKQGDVLSELGKGDEAMARYREVIERYPETEVAERLRRVVRIRELEEKGRALYREFRFADAAKAFREVAAADSASRPRMAYFDVLCLYGQGLDDAAGKRARELAETCENPKVRADATLWLAKFLYNRGEWKESGRLFVAFVDMRPKEAAAPEALTWASRAAFAENDFAVAILRATRLVENYPSSAFRSQALLVQGESLIELARFDEAVLVLEGVAAAETTSPADRLKAQVLKADALFAMGADNPVRYRAALEAYRAVRFGSSLSLSGQLVVSFKIARTLEKLKRTDEATDQYYAQVVLAYLEGRQKGERFDDEARAAFSRAALRLADEYEHGEKDEQARNVLKLLAESDVPAAEEAARRMRKISTKGRFL